MKKISRTKQTYQDVMNSVEEQIISDIDTYVKLNNIKYTCNSPDFIQGLALGLKVASENVYNATMKTPVIIPESKHIALYKAINDMKNT